MKKLELIEVDEEYKIPGSVYYVTKLIYLSKYGASTKNNYSEVTNYELFDQDTVVIEFLDAKEKGPSKDQVRALDQFLVEENKIASDVIENIYKYYERAYSDYFKGASSVEDDISSIEKFLPKIMNGNELDDLIKLNSILIHSSKGGVSKLGLSFTCSWDDEHGLGVLIENNRVVETGFADTAYPY